MKSVLNRSLIATMFVVLLGFGFAENGQAEQAAISDVPLANSPSDAVLPNLMYILDDSGSMMWDYMPDNVHYLSDNTPISNCKNSAGAVAQVQCADLPNIIGASDSGEAPYYSPQFNQIYYNPDISYAPGVTALGVSMGNSSATAAKDDAYINASTTVNLTTSYPEIYYCTINNPSSSDLTNNTKCRRNGVDNTTQAAPLNYFLYWSNNATNGTPLGAYPNGGTFSNHVVKKNGHPYYFVISAHEYCSDINLTTCALAADDGSAPNGFSIPAPIRYCTTTADAAATTVINGGSPAKCRKKYDKTSYAYPRYGRFKRVDIVSTTATYSKSVAAVRPDCANATYCTYAEELQNFANWYSYYRTRMALMKTATGRAFLPIDDRYRVGFITINPGNDNNPAGGVDSSHPVQAGKYLALGTYNATQKSSFYSKLYAQSNGGGTPLRQALSRIGRHYANITSGINNGMPTDPITHSCQQNFALLTTDGYWNEDTNVPIPAVRPNNTAVGNQDNTPNTTDPFYVARKNVTLDGLGTNFTNVQPKTTLEQTLCSGNLSTAFPSGTQTLCGCTGVQKRIIQRRVEQTTTTTGTDGVQSGSNTATDSTTFENVPTAACNARVDTTVTPVTQVEQALCSANNPVLGTSCGCGTLQNKVLQRTLAQTRTDVTTDGAPTSSNTVTNSTGYTVIAACNAKIETITSPVTQLDQAFCSNNNPTALGINCGCSLGQNRVFQRQLNQTNTTIKTDGTITSNNTVTNTTAISDIQACNSKVVTTTTNGATAVESKVCTGTATVTFSNGTTQNCVCNSGTKMLIRLTTTGATHKVVTTDGAPTSDTLTGGSPAFAYSTGSGFSGTKPSGGSCASSGTSLTASGPTYTGGSTTTGSTGATVTASQITLSPNPKITTVTGPTVLTPGTATVSATNITLTPNPKSTNGTGVTTGVGTQITASFITLNPNPTITPGIVNVTEVPGGTADTLADVAMYYYKNDLRTTGTVAPNNVPTTDKDIAPHQHMVTFTLGMGLEGLMDYSSNYESALTGDFAKIKAGSTGCPWSLSATTVCNWPAPTRGMPTTLDDLWHAAVNGRGIYYSASDPNSLADGLAGALSALKIQTAAASASATSSPNITQTDNFIYSSTFRTVKWDGEIVAQRIDTSNGNVLPAIAWSAQALLDAQVSTTSDTRSIWTYSSAASSKLKAFLWGNLTSTEQAFFNGKCTSLSQCALLTATQKTSADDGQNLVNFLRGQTSNEATLYRDREHVLGDPVNATPSFVKSPRFNFNDTVTPAYATFKTTNAARQGVLYIAANDGMLHAFNGDTGQEMWAYIPRMVMPVLYNLATDNWDVRHQFIVDGSPQIMDVYDSSASAWKTILIAGLNKGGRGYYALDITDPANPKGMWEICSDASLCSVSDTDLGLTFGYPVITKRATDGRWIAVVTSGLNNVSPGTGRGYLYVLDAFTGAILQKVDTAAGDTTTPAGLDKISGFANNFNVDNTATYIYGGDLLGNVWRFDMTVNPPAVFKLAVLTDAGGKPQSITTRPELAVISGYRVVYIGTGRYLGDTDLVDPATLSPALPWAYQQSLYAIKDRSVANGNIRTATPGLVQQTIVDSGGTTRTTTSATVDWATKDGWYVDFNPSNSSPGERVNLDPQLNLGTLVVATNVPNNSACTVGGDSWLYQFDYRSGTYIASASGAIAAQKFTGQTLVGIVVVRLPNGVLKAIATGATGVKTPVGVNVGGGGSSGRRVSWRELIQ